MTGPSNNTHYSRIDQFILTFKKKPLIAAYVLFWVHATVMTRLNIGHEPLHTLVEVQALSSPLLVE